MVTGNISHFKKRFQSWVLGTAQAREWKVSLMPPELLHPLYLNKLTFFYELIHFSAPDTSIFLLSFSSEKKILFN